MLCSQEPGGKILAHGEHGHTRTLLDWKPSYVLMLCWQETGDRKPDLIGNLDTT